MGVSRIRRRLCGNRLISMNYLHNEVITTLNLDLVQSIESHFRAFCFVSILLIKICMKQIPGMYFVWGVPANRYVVFITFRCR